MKFAEGFAPENQTIRAATTFFVAAALYFARELGAVFVNFRPNLTFREISGGFMQFLARIF